MSAAAGFPGSSWIRRGPRTRGSTPVGHASTLQPSVREAASGASQLLSLHVCATTAAIKGSAHHLESLLQEVSQPALPPKVFRQTLCFLAKNGLTVTGLFNELRNLRKIQLLQYAYDADQVKRGEGPSRVKTLFIWSLVRLKRVHVAAGSSDCGWRPGSLDGEGQLSGSCLLRLKAGLSTCPDTTCCFWAARSSAVYHQPVVIDCYGICR